MTTYVMRDGKLVEKHKASPLGQLHIQSDIQDVFVSDVDGKTLIHSKAQWQRHLREHGKHVSEPGDVRKRQGPDQQQVTSDVKRALQQLGVVG